MNKRRLLRKLLSLRWILLYLIVIAIVAVICVYSFAGLKASTLDVTADNVEFNTEGFVYMSGKTYEDGYENQPGKWVAQNDTMVMYFNEKTSIITVYTYDDSAVIGTESHNGQSYSKIDLTKCKQKYQTAQVNADSSGKLDETGANFTVKYANSNTGKLAPNEINTMTNSVQYLNTITGETEEHFYTKDIENGIQVLYDVGNFSAGLDYFPKNYYATFYRPDPAAYYDYTKEEFDDVTYKLACDRWVAYMETFGLGNASEYLYDVDDFLEDTELDIDADSWKENGYVEISKALAETFDERFRGNCAFITSQKGCATPPSGQIYRRYTGTLRVFTREALEYVKQLILDNYGEDITDSTSTYYIKGIDTSMNGGLIKEKYTNNLYWEIQNLPEEFFTDHIGEWFNNYEESPLTVNIFLTDDAFDMVQNTIYKLDTSFKFDPEEAKKNNKDTNEEDNRIFFNYQRYDSSLKGVTLKLAYNTLYNCTQFARATGEYYLYNEASSSYEPLMLGGFVGRDENGDFNYVGGELENKFYDLNIVQKDNELFGVESETSLPIFQIGIQFLLTEDGLQTTIMADSIIDAQKASKNDLPYDGESKYICDANKLYYLANVSVLPYFTYVDNGKKAEEEKETGMIIVPDGSGATINFNNGKSNLYATAVNANYYGDQMDTIVYSNKVTEDSLDLMLGMYGMIYTTPSNPRAVLSVIEKGGNQISLYAHTDDNVVRSYFISMIRANEIVKIGAYTSKNEFGKWAKNQTKADLQFEYIFLGEDEANYVSLANKYREYLIKRDNITVKDNTEKTVVDLNFLGSFEKYALFLGFKYKTPDSLTTFKQAQNIIDELTEKGVEVDGTSKTIDEINVSYTAWTNEELEYDVGGKVKVSGVLGGKKGMQNFTKYLADKNIDIYPELNITSTKKYDYSFGKLKYSARSVSNTIAQVYQFDVATQRHNKKVAHSFMISPLYYEVIANAVSKEVDKLKIDSKVSGESNLGYYLIDLGNTSINTYKKDEEVYGQEAIIYQTKTLEQLAQNQKLKIKAPYDYAIKYASFITDVPLTSTARAIYDEVIPFYQLVVSGLVDYTTEQINGTSNKSADWFFAKAVESGSNLSFVISAENPNVLLDTDYTYFYQSFYDNWKETIVKFANEIDELGISKGRLVYHKNIDKNIANVKYELKDGSIIDLIVNTTGSDWYYATDDVTIKAYSVYIK